MSIESCIAKRSLLLLAEARARVRAFFTPIAGATPESLAAAEGAVRIFTGAPLPPEVRWP